jgi:thymidylate synthase (FAD)
MQVKLISHSQTDGKELLMSTSASELVAYCARVSNPDNQNNKETSEKLIKYLMKHKHWSPLEMVSVCLEIETTRDIGRQILRHRSFSFQEFSQRYADPTKDLEFVTREARLQDEKNRQNSIEIGTDIESFQIAKQWDEYQKDIIRYARQAYCWAIENGIAKEQARAVLPEGNTMSRMYVNGTLRSWIHYIELRGANGTQKEHIAIANEVAKVISNVFPLAKEFKGKEI